MLDVCIVGHVTRDRIVIGRAPPVEQAGGVPSYAAPVYRALGLATGVVTGLGEGDEALLAPLSATGASVRACAGPRTTAFDNLYPEGGRGPRRQRVGAIAATFRVRDLRGLEARLWHLGPLTRRDVSAAVVRALAARGGRIALDAQGIVRRVRRGAVQPGPPARLDLLAHVAVLKADIGEAAVLSGKAEPLAAAEAIAALGPVEVALTLGPDGALILADGRAHEIPPLPPHNVADATGAGDTWFAAYLGRRLGGAAVPDAARFAAAATAVKLARPGPFAATIAEVELILSAVEHTDRNR